MKINNLKWAKKHGIRFVGMFVAMLMLLSFFPVSAIANGDPVVLGFSMTPENPDVGDVVTVTINVCENPGFTLMTFGISSNYLSPITGLDGRIVAERGANFNGLSFQAPYPGNLFVIPTSDIGNTGVLITISFEVDASIAPGTIPISLNSITAFSGGAILTVEQWCDYCGCDYCSNTCDELDCQYCNPPCCPYYPDCECNYSMLTISNWPANLTPDNQTVSGNREIDYSVTLVQGNAGTAWVFLGWTTYANRPATGTAWVDATQWTSLTFYMPGEDLHLVAVWGNNEGIVGQLNSGPGGTTGGTGTGGGTTVLPPDTPPLAPDIGQFFTPYHNAFLVGFPDGTVRPRSNISRAEVTTILFRLLNDDFRSDVWSQQNQFSDVRADQWFNNAISTMSNAGIINGSNGQFRPNDPVTRAEFAAMIARFFTEYDPGDMSAFADIEGNWAEDYINLIAEFGWIQGAGNGSFNPNELMTRAEAAAIVTRMLNRVLDSTDDLLAGRTRWPDKTNMNAWYYLYLQEATHSTEFERMEGGNLRWTSILPHLNWSVLERPESRPGDIVTERELQRTNGAS